MTSRLKRKLHELGIDPSSTKANENFCLIGTPLPPLDKSKDAGEFVPLWKQDVRDEKGRKRLHGAFTGGFSAGYFNTVGSKEGWTPSTYTSSRAERAKKSSARPEDFMDEEDLAEMRESQKLVDTTEEMDMNRWSREGNGESSQSESIVTALEAALLPAPKDSVGAKILRKMGWRPGYGIGPRITYEQRRRQDILFLHESKKQRDIDDDDEAKKHLYPPPDTNMPALDRKDDFRGIGVEVGKSLTEIINDEAGLRSEKGKGGPNIGAGFGLGALNDADEDDVDIYDREPDIKSGSRIAYNVEDKNERVIMGSCDRIINADRGALQTSRTARKIERQFFKSGMPCVAGFIVSEKTFLEERRYPLPEVPKGWTPNPRGAWAQDKEHFNVEPISECKTGGERAPKSADQRGILLGETPLPHTPRSVFDYLAPKDRERLKRLAEGLVLTTVPKQAKSGQSAVPSVEPFIPRLDPQIAKLALQGFQPFINDPVKHARYTAFLKAQAEGADTVPFAHAPGQTVHAFDRELQDYVRNAQVFRPMSGAMAGRFARSTAFETSSQSVEGLHQPSEGSLYLMTSVPGQKEENQESPKENAARLGMYGPLTHDTKPWTPAKLLCKRFGMKVPDINLSSSEPSAPVSYSPQNGDTLAPSDDADNGLSGSTRIGDEEKPSSPNNGSTMKSERDLANIGLGEDDLQGKDILTYQRPGMDFFKAIFSSDDEDDEAGGRDEDSERDVSKSRAETQEKGIGLDPTHNEGVSAPAKPLLSAVEQPAAYVDVSNVAGKVDITSFKPTFVPRAKDDRHGKEAKSKDKDKKKKKSKMVLVSFEVDEEGGSSDSRYLELAKGKEEKRERKKQRGDTGTRSDFDEDSMWVEKPPPDVVQNQAMSPPITSLAEQAVPVGNEKEAGPLRGRKRAVDFM